MRSKITLGLSAALLSTSVVSIAQVTTSGMRGTVTDDKNETIPGAYVAIVHTPSGTKYQAVTSEAGIFVVQGMRTGGPYTVTIEAVGTGQKTFSNIYLNLGEDYVLNAKVEGTSEALSGVTVTASRNDILNSERTGASTHINNRTLNRLPSISRSLTDFTRLTPQANGNGFAGRDGRYNNLQVDGANFNNAFGLSSDPLPGGSNQPISLDAVAEMSVNIAPYDVRQTGFTGAGINAVTKSGTNKVEGSVYLYERPKSFTGLDVAEQTLATSARTNNRIIGGRIGAPLIKNKLFIFGSLEYERSSNPGNPWLANKTGADAGANVTRVLESDLNSVSNYLRSRYGYDPGRFQGYADNYINSNVKGLLRLDWNITDAHQLTVRFNTMMGSNQLGANASSGPNPRSSAARISKESMVFEHGNYTQDNKVTSVTAELNSKLSNKMSNQLLATYSRINDKRGTTGDLFPFVDIWKDGTNYMSFGTELFSYDNEVINNNFNITNNLTYTRDKHSFTGGLSFQYMGFGNSYKRMGTSYYRYNDLSTFLAGGAPDVYGVTYPYTGQDGYARVNYALGGIYVQDKYSVNNKLNITGGIRVDMPFFLNTPVNNPAIEKIELLDKKGNPTTFSTASWPGVKPLLSPRVGFNYDVNGDRSLQLRGGTGIFTGNIPFVWFTNMPTNSGMLQNTFEPVSDATLAKITSLQADPMYWVKALPEEFPAQGGLKAPGSFSLIDKNFKMPQVWRSNLGADFKLGKSPLVLTADLIYTKDIVGVYQYNANRKAATATLNFENDNRDLWASANDAKYNAGTGTIIPVLSNNNLGSSFAGTLGLTLQYTQGLFGSLFYTYSASKDITGNPGSAAGSAWSNNYSVNDPNELRLGYSQYAIPHRIMGNIAYKVQNTTFSVFYNGANQGRFSYVYSNDINRDGVSLDLLYIPEDVNQMKFSDITNSSGDILFTAAEQRSAFDAFIKENGLEKYKGTYVDRNNGLMPWLHRFDFRFMQDIDLNRKNGQKLQLSLDIMNVGNLLNKDWGVLKQLNAGNDYAYGLLKVDNINADGVPTFQMNTIRDQENKTVLPATPFRNNFSASSTWGMQFGIRYIF